MTIKDKIRNILVTEFGEKVTEALVNDIMAVAVSKCVISECQVNEGRVFLSNE